MLDRGLLNVVGTSRNSAIFLLKPMQIIKTRKSESHAHIEGLASYE